MRGLEQVKEIITRLSAGQKAVHHGGHYCTVGGDQFYAKHLQYAKAFLKSARKNKGDLAMTNAQVALGAIEQEGKNV